MTMLWRAEPVDVNSDIVTPAVQALAALFHTYLTPHGHIYDLGDSDPSPDVVTRLQAGPGDVLFWHTVYAYDVDKAEWGGGISTHYDEALIQTMNIIAPYTGGGALATQSLARAWPHKVRSVVLAHNTLSGTCWEAQVRSGDQAKIGSFPDADGKLWLTVTVPIHIRWELALATGS